MSATQDRANLLAAIQRQGTLEGQMRAVAALDQFDAARRQEAADAAAIDLADTRVQAAFTPVRVHEHHTASTDWLGQVEASSPANHHAIVAEAAMWFGRVSADVKADPEEFGTQAEGFIRRQASQYGEGAEAAAAEGLAYLGFLYRQGASGLDQIQQTVDPNNQTKTTPLNPEVFDNFASEVDPINAGVVGTEDSNRAPLIQEIVQEGGGSAAPEVQGGHSTSDDFSGGYSEVPIATPEQMAAHGASSHEPCPDHQGQHFNKSTGDCSCGSNHRGHTASLEDDRSVALGGYVGNLDDFRPGGQYHEAASTLEQVQEVVDANNQEHPENPLPTDVMFPWLMSPNKSNGDSKKESSLSGDGGDDPFSSAPEGARTAAVRSTKPMVAGEGAFLYNPHDSGQKHTVSPGTKTTPGQRYRDMFGEHADHKVEGLPGEWQLGGEWHHHDGSGSVTGSLKAVANYGIARSLYGMSDGDEKSLDVNGHGPYKVSYHSHQAEGDDGKPAKGFHVGRYEVTTPDGSNSYFTHTPHGPGLSGAQPYAADEAARHIAEHYRQQEGKKASLQTQAGGNGYATWSTDNADWHDTPDLMHEDDPGWSREDAEEAKRMTQEEDPNHAHDLEVRPYTHPNKRASLQRQADMFGNSDLPHSVMQPGVANSPDTTPNPNDGYEQGKADGLAGNSPTTADGRTHPRYADGYAAGVAQAKDQTPKDVPHSMTAAKVDPAEDAGLGVGHIWTNTKCPAYKSLDGKDCTCNNAKQSSFKTSSLFVRDEADSDADFNKGYHFASRWNGGRLALTGSLAFESGIYAGITDNAAAQPLWVAEHQKWAAKFPVLSARLESHEEITDRLVARGVLVKNASDYPLECYSCGKSDPTGEAFFANGKGRKCPDCGSEQVHSPDAGKNWGKKGSTSVDLDTTGPTTSPDPGGQTPINGPGTKPVLEGQGPPNAPAGPGPYQGAPPYGHPVVVTVPTPSAGPHTVNDVLGGPVDGNARVTSNFRQRVQANLLRTYQGLEPVEIEG